MAKSRKPELQKKIERIVSSELKNTSDDERFLVMKLLNSAFSYRNAASNSKISNAIEKEIENVHTKRMAGE